MSGRHEATDRAVAMGRRPKDVGVFGGLKRLQPVVCSTLQHTRYFQEDVLFQDSGETTTTDASGDPVGATRRPWTGDKGLHQTVDADRPIYRGMVDGTEFPGGSEYLRRPDSKSEFNFAHQTGVFSIGMEVYIEPEAEQDAGVPDLLSNAVGSDTTGFRCLWGGDNNSSLRFVIRTDGGNDTNIQSDANVWPSEQWVTVWWVGDGERVYFYADGEEVGDGAIQDLPGGDASHDVVFFRRPDSNNFTHGNARWVAMYDESFSQDVIQEVSP